MQAHSPRWDVQDWGHSGQLILTSDQVIEIYQSTETSPVLAERHGGRSDDHSRYLARQELALGYSAAAGASGAASANA